MSNDFMSLISQLLTFLGREVLYSSILFLFIWPLSFILRKRSPYWQYGLWLIFFLRLVVPADFHFSFSVRSAIDDLEILSPDAEIVHEPLWGINYNQEPLVNSSGNEGSTESNILFYISLLQNKMMLILISFVWIAGVFLITILFFRKHLQYRTAIKHSVTLQLPKVDTLVLTLRKQLAINRKVTVVSGDHILSPFTTGLVRPVVYIPKDLLKENMETIEAIIAHEMVHIKLFDNIWLRIQNLIQIIYFFHPLVWFAGSRLNDARERICDRYVLNYFSFSSREYAEALLKILMLNTSGLSPLTVKSQFLNHKNRFHFRFKEILEAKPMSKKSIVLISLSLVTLAIIILPMSPGKAMPNSGLIVQPYIMGPNEWPTADSTEKKEISFVKPIRKGNITSGFGTRIHPLLKVKRHHEGIDISASKGTELYATSGGKVVFVGEKGGWGKLIIIDHENNYQSRYAHLYKILVNSGEEVKQGQLIGKVGNTGLTTVPHVHFEIRKDQTPVNPAELIDFSGLIKK